MGIRCCLTCFLYFISKSYVYYWLALFPVSPLTPTKNKNGGGEPGTDSHVISRHNDITAICCFSYKSRDAIMLPCDWPTRTATLLLLKQVSCDCVGETSARLKQQRRWRSTQYVGKTLPFYCYHVLLWKIAMSMKKDFSSLALHSGVQNKITTAF